MDTGVVYNSAAKGDCNFGEVFTTDGRIKALHLRVLQDDKNFLPGYQIALNVRQDTLKNYPAIRTLFEPLRRKLTIPLLQDLNAKADVGGQDPVIVADDYLKSVGLVK